MTALGVVGIGLLAAVYVPLAVVLVLMARENRNGRHR